MENPFITCFVWVEMVQSCAMEKTTQSSVGNRILCQLRWGNMKYMVFVAYCYPGYRRKDGIQS